MSCFVCAWKAMGWTLNSFPLNGTDLRAHHVGPVIRGRVGKH